MNERSGHMAGILLVSFGIVAGLALVASLYVWDAQVRARAAENVAGTSAPAEPISADSTAPGPPSSPTVVPGVLSAPSSTPAKPSAVPSVASSPTPAPATAGGTPNVQAGQALYQKSCQGCHPGGDKGVGPALKGAAFQQEYATDDALAAMIRKGKGAMPAFSSSQIDDASLASLIAYIRSLK